MLGSEVGGLTPLGASMLTSRSHLMEEQADISIAVTSEGGM